ncbi:MAG: hypothetical protein HFF39_10220 [Lawsonibacter sp.]|nr:hypothetical protein [Lawsonibacter sp.]
MKIFQRAGALALTLALLAGCLSGCAKPEETPPAASSAPIQAPEIELSSVTDPFLATAGLSADTVVASAGEVDITAGLLLYWVASRADTLMSYYGAYGGLTELPWDTEIEGVTLAQSILSDALETSLLYALLPRKAAQEGLSLSADFQTNLDRSLEQVAESVGGEELLNHYLWQFPLTRQIYTEMCQSEDYNSVMTDARFGQGQAGYPDDAQIFTFLEEEQQCYFFKHILFLVEENAPEEDSSAAGSSSAPGDNSAQQKQRAEEVLAQLRASEDPIALFDQLMNEYSEDGGLASYPDGYLGTAGEASAVGTKMVSVVEEACLSMEEGQISGVLENEQGYRGYHIVLRLPLEENVDPEEYRQAYIADRMNALQQEWIDEHEIVTNEEYDRIDPGAFYTALTQLRQAVSDEMAALEQPDASGSQNSSSGSQNSSSASSGASGSQK